MKLRNKKTGEAVYVDFQIPLCNNNDVLGSYCVTSLKELNKSFEDYESADPLIKDEKIRKVVRAWAKVNRIPTNATTIEYHFVESLCGTESEFWDNNLHIMFYGKIAPNAVHGKIYTIDELCGEEE